MSDKEAPPPVVEERIEDIADVLFEPLTHENAGPIEEIAFVFQGEKRDEPGNTTQG